MSGSVPLGLTSDDAHQRLLATGPNELARSGERSLWQIAQETAREPMFLLLAGAAGLYLALGDLAEGLFLAAGALASVGLVIVQETRSERALAALRELSQPMAKVFRDGKLHSVPARELVPDDVIIVGEGDRAPADGVLSSGDVLSVDESVLTGESAPMTKMPEVDVGRVGDGSRVFAGTLVVRGQGTVRVTHTGKRSALGRIGASLAEIRQEATPLQKASARAVGWLSMGALTFCALVALAHGLLRGDWVGGALTGITFAISLIPEEFPMVLAIFLALGARRLATHQVLVRRSAVIETLGSASVLCVDKTGTLTENRMQVVRLWGAGHDTDLYGGELPGEQVNLVRLAVLASSVHPVDPMDRAVHALSTTTGTNTTDLALEKSWPLRPGLLAVVQAWRMPDQSILAAAKGAPEAILSLCRMPAAEAEALHGVVASWAQLGLRVLGVASLQTRDSLGESLEGHAFQFAGLVGFLDPLRVGVPQALAEARSAGIRVMMITGDHPQTALAIARSAGVETIGGVLLGADIASMPFRELCEHLKAVAVFARVQPEQKLRIVEALKASGEVVAMTGDGVNDAPALEAAHIGIAMGRKGTEVAREAADLVILDDSFNSIVGGVRLGRRIFANLRQALIFVVAVHVPIAGLALLPILFGLPAVLFPMHVVLLELAIDPVCALVFEASPSAKDSMLRPPRPISKGFFGRREILRAVVQGLVILAAIVGLYLWGLSTFPETQARGAAFAALVVAILALALADSASSGSFLSAQRRVYWVIAAAAVVVLAVVLFVPFVSAIFLVTTPSPGLLVAAFAVAIASGAWPAIVTRLSGRRVPTTPGGADPVQRTP